MMQEKSRGTDNLASSVTPGLEPPAARSAPPQGTTVKFVYDQLRDDILQRRMGPGWRLIEHDLTERFGVSRGPVREALRRLAAEGLIDHVPNRGGTVRRLSSGEMGELFEIRIALEALAARRAAENRDPVAVEAFRLAVEPLLDDAPRDFSTYLDENSAFHSAILTLAGSKALQELVDRLQLTLLMAQVSDRVGDDVIKTAVGEHRKIVEAILSHDAEGAGAAIQAHLERAAALAVQSAH